jgi:hypothetical protein
VNFIIELHFEGWISPLIAAIENNDPIATELLLKNGARLKNRDISISDYVTDKTSPDIIKTLGKIK